ncbi:MAG TPA: AAA family ATPase, partial [Armatimonadota bacterium]|nr:AAA family ATPase [Armatimonadota bacterium]
PGTGKTYWAEIAARDLSSYAAFGLPFEKLTAEQRERILGREGKNNGLVRLCSFHPAYGYEDFLEGYRPETVNESITFPLRDGVFKQLCADAAREPEQPFYLLIDEINRGDIPRIFGELMTVLEKSKRGKSITLPVSGKPFHVPPNVFVIGTMNTADRSIALLDTALRRRFGFIELLPDKEVLGGQVVSGIPLGPWLEALNQRICEHVGRDARNLQIGHTYLLDGEKPVSDFAHLSRVLREDIIPLLEEYCYEDYTALARILGPGLVDETRQVIREELFAPASQQDLIQALLLPCPEIAASQPALSADAGTAGDASAPETSPGALLEEDDEDPDDSGGVDA